MRSESADDYATADSSHFNSNDVESVINPSFLNPLTQSQEPEDVLIKYEPNSPGSIAESEDTTSRFLHGSGRLEEADSPRKEGRCEESNDELTGRSIAAELAFFKESREKRMLKAKIFQLIAEYEGPVK